MQFEKSFDAAAQPGQDNIINYLNDQVDLNQDLNSFDISFSQTKTNHQYLKLLFQKQYDEIEQQYKTSKQNEFGIIKLYLTAEQFVQKLQESKLYTDVDVFLLPGKLHFQMKDRSPFFMSLSNNFDRVGASTVQFKAGSKNFLGYHDTLQFEIERLLGVGAINWALDWKRQLLSGTILDFSLHQSERGINHIYETKKGVVLKIIDKESDFTCESGIRSNKINFNTSEPVDYQRMRQFCSYLDFLPSSGYFFGLGNNLINTMEESRIEKVNQGLFAKMRNEIGLTNQGTILKTEFGVQHNKPLYGLKKLLYNFKYTSLQTNLNAGISYSFGRLNLSDTSTNITYRGFNEFFNPQKLNGPTQRFTDVYSKLDFKLNCHNTFSNARLFYFLSMFSTHQLNKQDGYKNVFKNFINNGRMAGGIGIAMDVQERVSIEVLLNMFHLGVKKYDKASGFQIRMSMND